MGSTPSTDLQHYNVAVIATLPCSAVFRARLGAPGCDVVRQQHRMTWNGDIGDILAAGGSPGAATA
jgi:hypothetical protein